MSLDCLMVAFGEHLNHIGLMWVAENARANGFSVKNLYLTQGEGFFESEKELNGITKLVGGLDPKVIGFSIMTLDFKRAVRIIKKIKARFPKKLVLLGGVHATLCPEECIRFADAVCVGCGEDAIAELLEKVKNSKDFSRVQNLWVKRGNKVFKNPVKTEENLDRFPFPKFRLWDDLIQKKGFGIEPLNRATLESWAGGYYLIFVLKGCPFSCSYCSVHAIRKATGFYGFQTRSIGHVMEEVNYIKKEFDFVSFIHVMDDCFAIQSEQWIEEFSNAFSKTGLKLICHITPSVVSERKISLLAKAGLKYANIGIETGCEEISREVYNRDVKNQDILNAARILKKHGVKPIYDVIINYNSDYEKDWRQTIELLSRLPKPFNLRLLSLIAFPKTNLDKYYKSKKISGGLNPYKKSYRCVRDTYFNRLLACSPLFPSFLLRFLSGKSGNALAQKLVFLVSGFLEKHLYYRKGIRLDWFAFEKIPFLKKSLYFERGMRFSWFAFDKGSFGRYYK